MLAPGLGDLAAGSGVWVSPDHHRRRPAPVNLPNGIDDRAVEPLGYAQPPTCFPRGAAWRTCLDDAVRDPTRHHIIYPCVIAMTRPSNDRLLRHSARCPASHSISGQSFLKHSCHINFSRGPLLQDAILLRLAGAGRDLWHADRVPGPSASRQPEPAYDTASPCSARCPRAELPLSWQAARAPIWSGGRGPSPEPLEQMFGTLSGLDLLPQSLPRYVQLVGAGAVVLISVDRGDGNVAIADETPMLR